MKKSNENYTNFDSNEFAEIRRYPYPVSVSGIRIRYPYPVSVSGIRIRYPYPLSVSAIRIRYPYPVSAIRIRYPLPAFSTMPSRMCESSGD